MARKWLAGLVPPGPVDGPGAAEVEAGGRAPGGADPHGVAVGGDREGAVERRQGSDAVDVRPRPGDGSFGGAGLLEAVEAHPLAGVVVGDGVGPARQHALPGAAEVGGAHRSARKEGGPHRVALDGQPEAGVVNRRPRARLEAGAQGVEDRLVGDPLPAGAGVGGPGQSAADLGARPAGQQAVEEGGGPHRVPVRGQGAHRPPAQAVLLGEGDPVAGFEAVPPGRVEAGQAALRGHPQVAAAPDDVGDAGADQARRGRFRILLEAGGHRASSRRRGQEQGAQAQACGGSEKAVGGRGPGEGFRHRWRRVRSAPRRPRSRCRSRRSGALAVRRGCRSLRT